jgi:hypothetical protein
LHLKALAERKFLLLFLFPCSALSLSCFASTRSAQAGAFLVAAIVLAIPTLIQHISGMQVNPGAVLIGNIVLSFAFDLLIVVLIFRRIFAPGQITSERSLAPSASTF